jgi:NAD(P)-dependent dehydrogenase (short-subunit alcohol dehydrogenase family)
MRIDLHGKRALVTGSTSGIGFAIARGLAEAGAAVVLHGRSQDHVDEARARLASEAPGAQVSGHAAELADGAAIRALTDAVSDIDILVHNAGPFGSAPFLQITDEDWQRYQDIYVTAAVRLSRHYLPGMLRARWGRILCSAGMTCSYTPGDPAIATMVAWLTSKAALLGLARGLAEVAAGTGVTVNAFIPGPAHTAETHARSQMQPAYEQFTAEYFAGPGVSSVLRRFIAPAEVANLVVFLASEQASAITGATLRVDGGIIRTLS